MKIAEVGVIREGNGIYIARLNSRGNPKMERKNVTGEVIDIFVDICKTDTTKCKVYEKDGRVYRINVHELTEEELAEYRAEQAEKKHKAARRFAQLMGMTALYEPALKKLEPVMGKINEQKMRENL